MEQNEAFMTSPIGDLPINSDGLRKAVDEITRLNNEIAKLTEVAKKLRAVIAMTEQHFVPFLPFEDEFDEAIKEAKQQAVKEFAEKLKLKFDEYYNLSLAEGCIMLKDLLKEYGVEL